MRNVAIFRFSPTEGPAYFADWLDARGIGWELVPLDAGAAIPVDSSAYAGIGMMGGPMSVYDELPWIEPLCTLLRDAVARGVPVIGHCLGGQMLAKALGAEVARTKTPEIGWIDFETTDAAAAKTWFGGRTKFESFQWHSDAFGLPAGATRVLTNRYNPNQAYVVDDRHIGFQCHVEMTHALIDTWLRTGGDELPTTSSPALQTAADIRRDLDTHIVSLNAVASDVYTRWAQRLVL